MFFRNVSRGKKSVLLNLKSEPGRRALLDLCASADVFVEGFRPGVMARLGVDYEADKATMVDPVEANEGLPMEIWHSRDGVSTYPTAPEFLKAMADIRATAALVNASYVYDVETGLKLFGKTAFWVKTGDDYATFLRLGEAEAYAEANGGAVVSFDDAIADFVTEG